MMTEEEFSAKLAELEAQHGADGVRGIRTIKGGVFVVSPSGPAARRWRAETLSDVGAKKVEANLRLATSGCVVHPDKATFDAWADEKPGIAELVANAAVELAGFVEVTYRGKS